MTFELKERLLTITGLGLSYGDKLIFRDVNLAVNNTVRPGMSQGQCIALLGQSGCGKTQLMRCIAGFQQATRGTIEFGLIQDGKVKPGLGAGDVGFVQQSYPLLQHRTIMGNLLLMCKDKDRIVKLLDRFGVPDVGEKYPVQLSGGQRQRVAIIQQVITDRHFLLMDEPFSGLDVVAKDTVCTHIERVNGLDELNTIIFTTHDLETAIQTADTIWVMGRQRNPEKPGEWLPGSTVVKEYDLKAMGLAWQPNVTKHPLFVPLLNEIHDLFKTI